MFQLIKEHVNIARHIEKYTPLRQSGRLQQGLCPLHEDKTTSSLMVYPDNSFYCFGCHKGGSVIDFEVYRQDISPVDAARYLCDEYNLHPSYKDTFRFQQNLALRRQKESWLELLKGSFDEKPDIYTYIRKRGLSEQTVKDFNLGAGSSTNVVVIPINDKFGKVVAFARRNLDPDAKEKYLNDAFDNIYNKSEILFNIDKAKYHIKNKKAIVLNEGYFDVMSLWESGIKHAVAFCSSRITKEQSRLLQDMTDENVIIYLVPTNDKTAQNELMKNLTQIKINCPKNHVRTLVIPDDCKDLNDVLMKYGKEKIVEIYDNSIPVELYLVNRILKTEPILEMQYNKVRNLCLGIDNNLILDDICSYLVKHWNKSVETIRTFLFTKKSSDLVDVANLKTLDNLVVDYEKYIASLKENRISFGWVKTDLVTRGMRIGDVIQMIASTGVGKTLWAENLILNLTKKYPTLPIMFFSLEQLGVMAFERFMMIEGGLESNQVERWDKNDDIEIQKRLVDTLGTMAQNFKSFVLIDEGSMTLEKLESYVAQAGISIFSQPVKIIVVDYLGYLQGEGKDLYHKVSEISKKLKELAKKLRCVVVSLHQVSKTGKTGGDPIEGYMARDSGVVQESADIMISAWRPELKESLSDAERKDLENVFMTKVVKNRYGEAGTKIEFYFHKRHLKLLEKRDVMNMDEVKKMV